MNTEASPWNDPSVLSSLATRLAALSGGPPDPVRLAEAVIEAHVAQGSGEAWSAPALAAGARLGLRGALVRAPLAEIARSLGDGSPVLVVSPSGLLLLTDSLARRVRVEPLLGEASWQSIDALARQLGLSSTTGVVEGVALEVEAPLGIEDVATPHSAAHGSPPSLLWSWVLAERADVATLVVYALFVGLLSLVIPVTVQALVTTVTFGTLTQPLVVLALLVLGALAFAATLRGMSSWVVEVIQRRTFARVSAALVARLMRADRAALAHGGGRDLASRFFDVFIFQKSIASLLVDGLDVVLTAFVGMLILGFYHPVLLALDVVVVAAVVLVILGLGRRGPATAIDESYAKYEMAALFSDLASAEPSRALGMGPQVARAESERRAVAWLFARAEHFKIVLSQTAAMLALQALASAGLLGVGGYLVVDRQLTLGQLVAAELIVTTVVGALAKMGKHLETYYDAVAALDKVGHVLSLPGESTGAVVPPEGPLSVALEGVGIERLPEVTLALEPREKCSLHVDHAEARAQLSELLTTLRSAGSGRVRLGGIDRRDLELASIRARIELVRDDDTLVGRIMDVVRAGRASSVPATLEAFERVGLDVAGWPDSLRTTLGRDGLRLGRAERAQVLVARALLSGADLIVVDGLLDGLDPELATRLTRELALENGTLVVLTGLREGSLPLERRLTASRSAVSS